MPEHQGTTFDDHDPLAHHILQVLEDFIDEIGHRGCTGHFDSVLTSNKELDGRHLVQRPERFIEDHLVYPVLTDALDYSIRPQPKQYAPPWPRKSGVPDFCVTSVPVDVAMDNDLRVFGEVKRPKHIEGARKDMKEYLRMEEDLHAVAVLTDGFDCELWVRPRGRQISELDNPVAKTSLKDPLKVVRTRNMSLEPYRPYQVRNRIDSDGFEEFTVDSLISRIHDLGLDNIQV